MILVDIYRHTFPKGLRFCSHCRLLHAYFFVVIKRNKHRRYIPKEEFQEVLDKYVAPTPLPVKLLRIPVIRFVFLRPINTFRMIFGYKSYLMSPAAEVEYNKVKKWFDSEVNRNRGHKKLADNIEREKFQSEVLDRFPVATLYHRGVRVGAVVVTLLLLLLWMSAFAEYCLYLYLSKWEKLSRAELKEWMRQVTLSHLLFQFPEGYDSLLPPPAIVVKAGEQLPKNTCLVSGDSANASKEIPNEPPTSDSVDRIFITVAEFVSPDLRKSVILIPTPQCGTRAFFTRIGKLVSACDGVLLEGVSQKMLPALPPMTFFPSHGNSFEAANLQHRYMPLLSRGQLEPPQFFPGAMPPSLAHRIYRMLTPFPFRAVYFPLQFASTKADARIAWGLLREVLEDPKTMMSSSHIDPSAENIGGLKPVEKESFALAVPWTAAQVVSLEASLLKYGYTLASYKYVEWLPLDHIGESFCEHFQYES